MQALQTWLIGFAMVYWLFSFVLALDRRQLTRVITRYEAEGATTREGSQSYMYEGLKFRFNLSALRGLLIALLCSLLVGFAVVYVLITNLPIFVLIVIEAYLIYVNIDSIEAFLLSQYMTRSSRMKAGRWELQQGRWAVKTLGRGRTAFLLLGLTMFLLSLVASQLVTDAELAISYYVDAIYSLASVFSPISPGLSGLIAAVILVISAGGAFWLIRKVEAKIMRTSTRPE